MNTRQQQRGMSLPGMIVLAMMVGFFVMAAIKLVPAYFEYLSVREIVEKVSAEYEPEVTTIADIRRRLDNLFYTNQIVALKPREVQVFRKDGRTHIDASYEARVPMFWRIDAVLKFDDLEYIAGQQAESKAHHGSKVNFTDGYGVTCGHVHLYSCRCSTIEAVSWKSGVLWEPP